MSSPNLDTDRNQETYRGETNYYYHHLDSGRVRDDSSKQINYTHITSGVMDHVFIVRNNQSIQFNSIFQGIKQSMFAIELLISQVFLLVIKIASVVTKMLIAQKASKLSARPACSVFNTNDDKQATLLQHLFHSVYNTASSFEFF